MLVYMTDVTVFKHVEETNKYEREVPEIKCYVSSDESTVSFSFGSVWDKHEFMLEKLVFEAMITAYNSAKEKAACQTTK